MRRAGEVHNDVDEVPEERWFSCEGAGLKGFTTSLKDWHNRDLQFHVPKASRGSPRPTSCWKRLNKALCRRFRVIQPWSPVEMASCLEKMLTIRSWLSKASVSNAACLPATVTSSFTPAGKPGIVCMFRHSFVTSPLHLSTWWWGCCMADLTINLPCWQVLEVGLLLRAPPERPVGGAQWALHPLVMADKVQQSRRCQKLLQDCSWQGKPSHRPVEEFSKIKGIWW